MKWPGLDSKAIDHDQHRRFSHMNEQRYSIKDLENFTQIKAHTLRIWEQRYGLLKPRRTETNIRYYGEEDLKRILNVNLLYTRGVKISKIARMSDQEMRKQAQILIESRDVRFQAEIDQLIVSILQIDGEAIRGQIDKLHEELGMEELYSSIFLPLLQKIGELWQVNAIEVAHEHFFTNFYRDYIIYSTHRLASAPKHATLALLFLHEDEGHELSLLMNHYLLRSSGYRTVYLGQHTPIKEVIGTIQTLQPAIIVTAFVAKIDLKLFQEIISELSVYAQSSRILISGAQASFLRKYIPESFVFIDSPAEFKSQL